MKWRLSLFLWLVVMLCLSNYMARAQGTGDVLRFIVTNNSTSGINHYCYWRFSTVAYTKQASDTNLCIEYDVYLTAAMDGLGGIEVYSSGHTGGWRDIPGWVDLEGDSGHPATDLSNKALYRWHHRTLPVPSVIAVGESINKWNVATEWDTPSISGTAYYDNVVITNNGIVRKVIYQSGTPNKNVLEFENGIASRSLARVTTTPGDADMMRFTTTTHKSPGENAYYYYRFSSADYSVQPGDCIEYDAYLANNLAQLGGIEVQSNITGYWRDLWDTWKDQNNIPGAPYADISAYATNKWYHRVLTVPVTQAETITEWFVGAEYDDPATTATAYYDNIVITRNGVVQAIVYQSGQPPAVGRELDFYTGVTTAQLSAGPSRKTDTLIGTEFFFWHDRPNDGMGPECVQYTPPGFGEPYPGTNEWYTMKDQGWYQKMISDIKLAGTDYILPNTYAPSFNNYLENLVFTIQNKGSDLKVGMFMDGYDIINTPIIPANFHYWYDDIKPYFQLIPQSLWATHNGLPVAQGGRPVIVVYTIAYFPAPYDYADDLWSWVKTQFNTDFGVTPWIVLNADWAGANPACTTVEDGEASFGSGLYNPFTYTSPVNGTITSELGPGYDDTIFTYSHCTDGRPLPPRVRARFDHYADDKWTLVHDYNWAPESNLLIIETWNELWEGSGVSRMVDPPDTRGFPAPGGGYLPGDHYIQMLRNLRWTKPGVPTYDETFLSYSLPIPLQPGSAISFTLRNDGMNAWPATDTQMVARLLNTDTGAQVKLAYLGAASTTTMANQELTINATIPSDWTTGNYILEVYPAVNPANIYAAGATTVNPAGFGRGRLSRPIAIALGGITGTVTGNSSPLNYAEVRAFNSGGYEVGRATTDANGNYTMGLASGTYTVKCYKYTWNPWPAEQTGVSVPSSAFTTVNFALTQ